MPQLIRLAHTKDASPIQAIYAPIVTHTPISFETIPPSTEQMAQRIHQTLQNFPWLIYEDSGEVRGYAYASQHRARAAYQWSVDVSVYVHEKSRRQGVGKKLYTSLFHLLRQQGFYNAYAGITLPNPPSVALHESMGMQPLGVYQKVGYKLDSWYDVGWWQVFLQSHNPNPLTPKTMAELYLAEWQALL